ncbi:MAG: adenylate/guanylate cyclase domain-containing protein [Magnetococcales bacterium]|nr:adenylate/guanylate cyclase domain-containing protein [Magnetococcales bacterium]
MEREGIFGKEEGFLKEARAFLNEEREREIAVCGNTFCPKPHLDTYEGLLSRYDALLTGYEKLQRKLGVMMRISDKQQLKINNTNQELTEAKEQLERRNEFIRNIFGRYVSDDVVDSLLDSPEGLSLGGEKRDVTILMSDLRGFSAISDSYSPESVMGMLNIYLDEMTEVIESHHGTIDAFIGDGILVMFGAPVAMSDHPQRAVACAVGMQLAMERVNRRNVAAGYPEIAMGIGINSGSVVVGNIGSARRSKYTMIGMNVVHASRIESYTIGGQVLISSETRERCGEVLAIRRELQVIPKGYKEAITIHEVAGIGAPYGLHLPTPAGVDCCLLSSPVPVCFAVVHDKQVEHWLTDGEIVGTGKNLVFLRSERELESLVNLRLLLTGEEGSGLEVLAKVQDRVDSGCQVYRVAITHASTEAEGFLAQLQGG